MFWALWSSRRSRKKHDPPPLSATQRGAFFSPFRHSAQKELPVFVMFYKTKKLSKILKKTIDNSQRMWYTIYKIRGTKETAIEELPGSGSNKIQVFLLAAGGAAERAGTCKGGRNQWRIWTVHSSRRFRRSQLSEAGLTGDGIVSPSGSRGLMSRISILRVVKYVWFRCA